MIEWECLLAEPGQPFVLTLASSIQLLQSTTTKQGREAKGSQFRQGNSFLVAKSIDELQNCIATVLFKSLCRAYTFLF